MNCEEDYDTIQRDIDYLLDWAIRNKMKFHPAKCKVLSVSNPSSRSPFLGILPYIQYSYSLGGVILDYTESEKDLGIHMNSTLNFNEQALFLYAKANQKLGMLKRNLLYILIVLLMTMNLKYYKFVTLILPSLYGLASC